MLGVLLTRMRGACPGDKSQNEWERVNTAEETDGFYPRGPTLMSKEYLQK